MMTVVLGSSACGVSQDNGDQAFCDDWEIAISSYLEAADSLADGTGPMPVEAVEAGKLAGDRLRDMDWPSEVNEAMSLYFTMVDAGGPNTTDSSGLAEWQDANREIRDYLTAQCDIDQDSLDRWYAGL